MSDEKRPLRLCDSCGQVDDHPRHVFATNPDNVSGASNADLVREALSKAKSNEEKEAVLAAAMDNNVLTKHVDCCAADGCPGGSCDEILAKQGDRRGLDLAAALAPKED
jgi:hypothetical protein